MNKVEIKLNQIAEKSFDFDKFEYITEGLKLLSPNLMNKQKVDLISIYRKCKHLFTSLNCFHMLAGLIYQQCRLDQSKSGLKPKSGDDLELLLALVCDKYYSVQKLLSSFMYEFTSELCGIKLNARPMLKAIILPLAMRFSMAQSGDLPSITLCIISSLMP